VQGKRFLSDLFLIINTWNDKILQFDTKLDMLYLDDNC